MTTVLKLGFWPPIDQPRAFAETHAIPTHGAATHLAPGAIAQGTVRPDRDSELSPLHEEHRWPRAAWQTFPTGAARLEAIQKKLSI